MKNFKKKGGFFAVSAALLAVMAMLVTTWCSNDINGKADEIVLPAGKGAVKLNFNNDIARTIKPGDSSLTIGSFDEFQFTFTPVSVGSGTLWDNTVAKTDLLAPIILDPGSYTLTVIGRIEVSPNNMVDTVNNATPVPVNISAGKIAHETVELRYIIDGTGNGNFIYTLDKTHITPADITSATMTLDPLSANGTAHQEINIKDKFDDAPYTILLKTGIYSVKFNLVVGGDTVNFMHILHIYEDLDSTYTFSIGLNYFNAVYQFGSSDIIFDQSDKKPVIEYSIDGATALPYSEGTPISLTRGEEIEFTITNESIYTAFEWYCLGTLSLSSTDTHTIDTTLAVYPATYNQFSSARDYNLTVIGVANGNKYATIVQFSVTP